MLLETHLEAEWVERGYIPSPSPQFFGRHHKEFQRDNFVVRRASWQGVLLKRRVLTALKVIKVLWDCVCDSPAALPGCPSHTHTAVHYSEDVVIAERGGVQGGVQTRQTHQGPPWWQREMSLSSSPPLVLPMAAERNYSLPACQGSSGLEHQCKYRSGVLYVKHAMNETLKQL